MVGRALSTGRVARTQTRFGRKVSFQMGLVLAFASVPLCAYAAFSHNFWLLVSVTQLLFGHWLTARSNTYGSAS